MNDPVRQWLDDQRGQQRQLLLVIDSMAEPNPVQELFAKDLMRDYVNLYQGTELSDLTDVGPWLVALSESEVMQLRTMLDAPEGNWGWLASASRIDLSVLGNHWQARMLIEELDQRALYRLQDSRVIAHHLSGLAPEQRHLLLGPLASALCWDGDEWSRFDNPVPAYCPPPFATPWLDLPEPPTTASQIRRHNFLQWLWQEFPTVTAKLAEHVLLDDWVDDQLNQAEHWHWHALEQQRFLLRYRMDPVLASHAFWIAQIAETPEQHFVRCQDAVATMEHTHS
jgi:hypothetical protein